MSPPMLGVLLVFGVLSLREGVEIVLQNTGNLPLFFREHPKHMSHEKNPPTFHFTGLLIGILIMVYYNPYITG